MADYTRGRIERYLHGFGRADWRAVCATRTRADEAQMVKLAGSCERLFQIGAERLVASHPGYKLAWEASYYPVRVERRGPIIGVHFVSNLYRGTLALAAVKDAGQWRLEDLPDRQIP